MGSGGFDAHFDSIDDAVTAKMIPAAMRAMEMIRVDVASGTPIETGHLVGSEDVQPQPDGAWLLIPGPYARNQEYNPNFRHTTGHRLYLTLPMVQRADDALAMVARELGEVMDD